MILPCRTDPVGRVGRGTPGRASAAVLAGLLVLVSLSGCLKLDMDLAISGDTIDGTMIVALDKRLLDLTGQSEQELLAGFARDTNLPDGAGVSVADYADETYVGRTLILRGASLAEFAADASDPDELSITHDAAAGVYRVSGVVDLRAIGHAPGELDEIMRSLQVRIAITFPGRVIRHNGELDGTTVIWRPKAGEQTVIEAEAKEASPLPWLLVFAVVTGFLAMLAVVAALGFFVLRTQPSSEAAPPPAPTISGSQAAGPAR